MGCVVIQGSAFGVSIDVGLIRQGMVLVAVCVIVRICGVFVGTNVMQVEREKNFVVVSVRVEVLIAAGVGQGLIGETVQGETREAEVLVGQGVVLESS